MAAIRPVPRAPPPATTPLLVLLLLFSVPSGVDSLNLEKCPVRPLGLESGAVLDEQITASSSFDEQSVGPQNARIRTEKNSGAWCPKAQIRNSSYEFLQINFNTSHVIRAIETQGRFGNGTGQEFTADYFIDYHRLEFGWIRYRNRTGHELMTGNFDTRTAVMRNLDPPIVAKKIRIVPYSEQTRTMCLRVELYGCEEQHGLLAYSTKNNGSGDYWDRIFERTGHVERIMGSNQGFGLLTDGFISALAPNLTVGNSSWIGWSRDSTGGNAILLFEFESVRNFSDVQIFAWGDPRNVKIEVEFSRNGDVFLPEHTVTRDKYPQDVHMERDSAFSVRVPLQAREGKFVRITLDFQDPWLFLTEVNFNTGKNGTRTVEGNFLNKIKKFASDKVRTALYEHGGNASGSESNFGSVYYILVGVLFLLFFCFLAFILRVGCLRSHQVKKLGHEARRNFDSSSMGKSNLLVTTLGGNGAPRHIVHPPQPPPKLFNGGGSFFMPPTSADRGSLQRILSHSSRSCSSGTMSKDTPPSLLDIHFPPPPPSTESSEAHSDGIYEPCPSQPPLMGTRSASNTPTRRRRVGSGQSRRNRTLPSVVDEEGLLVCGSDGSVSSTGDTDPLTAVVRVPRGAVTLGPQIGEGKFTAIHTCELAGADQVAVIKFIKDTAEDMDAASKALRCEAQILAGLQHPNIVQLFGVSDEDAVLVEYLPLGSVREFILNERDKLSFGSLLHFCTNIASGMKYLEQRKIVHGHLSPRNCLVESNLNIKIAAPRGPLHHAQLRYSAPESIILNEWTHKSDAYSFAVTAWEILHYCGLIPFDALTNQELVDYARSVVNGLPTTTQLDFRDEFCPSEIGDLLSECCMSDPETRPAFLETQLFLSRKAVTFTLQHKRHRLPGTQLPQSASMYR